MGEFGRSPIYADRMADPLSIGALAVAVASAGFSAFQWRAGRDASRTTEKQRLEANAANVEVSVEGWSWPPARPSGYLGPDSSHMEGVPITAPHNVFRKTSEFDHQLELTGRFLIRNFSDIAVAISFEGRFYRLNRFDNLVPLVTGQTIRIDPQQTERVTFIDCRSVREWRDAAAQATVQGTIRYDDGFDVGVEDWWQVEFHGCPVRQVEDEPGAVEVPMSLPMAGTTPVELAMSRRHRDYYRSKVNRKKSD
jgi:hypothetical protein